VHRQDGPQVPGDKQTLIAVLDDATGKLLYAQLVKAESTRSVRQALSEVFGEEATSEVRICREQHQQRRPCLVLRTRR
jgi:hypothetical protein